jgi:iron donor protein CyaY
MDDQEFQSASEAALTGLQRDLDRAADRYGFEVDRNQGALTIEFDQPPAKFVVSPNSPVRQIWISARVKSFKLDWNTGLKQFVFTDGRNLRKLISDLVSEQLGETVML